MDPVSPSTADDPVLDALLLPFALRELDWPAGEHVGFLRGRAGDRLPPEASRWTFEQTFFPRAAQLRRAGMTVGAVPGTLQLAMLLPPRQRDEGRALLARAVVSVAGSGGTVLAAVANAEGARSAEADMRRLCGAVRSLSKHKCRVFWARVQTGSVDVALLADWLALDAPRPIDDGRFLSRPGLFAWDRVDEASQLLAAHLPADLRGRGADLGAGYGYLAAEVLRRGPGVQALSMYEAESRALDLARINLAALARDRVPPVELAFHWHDVTAGLHASYDFVVSNPPFHLGRADQPELGRAFIRSAARALLPGGRLFLVANRHLPYEAELAQGFARTRTLADQHGFKVIEAIKANA